MSVRDGLGALFLAFVAGAVLPGCGKDAPEAPAGHSTGGGPGATFLSPDPSGTVGTFSATGSLDPSNPFFQSLGTNGRSCASCHVQGDGWGLSAAAAQAIYASSGGRDPLFAAVDGADCPDAAAGAGAAGHSLLLNSGLIREALPLPAGAQFTIAVVHDPYGCALRGDSSAPAVSVYRRPLQATNLGFLSSVMFDGRETAYPLTTGATLQANLQADLAQQALDATLVHAQATTPPTAAQLAAIVGFELALFTAQASDDSAGALYSQGAGGGPVPLAGQRYYPGINDPLGGNPTGAVFNDTASTIFPAWLSLTGAGAYAAARAAVARGEMIFDTHPLSITGVAGLNDVLGVSVVRGTCTTCHDTPNVGNHSRPMPLDIGVSHPAAYETDPQLLAGLGQLDVPDLPVYRLSCTAGPLAGTIRYTSDPGRAMITGLCADIGLVKGPILRGLAARAPYFHNGAARDLAALVRFYDQRFQMALGDVQMADLVAYLRTL